MSEQTVDPRLAGLKQGDTVRIIGVVDVAYEFIGVHSGRVIAWRPATDIVPGYVTDWGACDILWPPSPKAEPGVVYRHKEIGALGVTRKRFGTWDGQLGLIPHSLEPIPMSSDWLKVEGEGE